MSVAVDEDMKANSTDDAHDRTFLVTGASSGIGRAIVEALAARGGQVVLAARSSERAARVLDEIKERDPHADARLLLVDLSDFSSIRRAAGELLTEGRRLDVLVNNAGVAGPFGLSKDGFDLTYATNHLGPFLLTNLLLPRLRVALRAHRQRVEHGPSASQRDRLDRPRAPVHPEARRVR